jgi:hypothetical protein
MTATGEECLARLIASGAVRPPIRKLPAVFRSRPLPKADASVAGALLEKRREGLSVPP